MGMSGAFAAMFTPYDAKGRVDAETIARIMDYGYANGLKGFYLTGTTGEWWLLSTDERRQVYAAAAKANRGRGRLIAHVGANCTDDSVTLARYAADIGIDCGWFRKPFEPLTAAQYKAYAKRFAALGIAKEKSAW